MNIVANWSYPTAVKLGRGRIKELAEACKTLGLKKPLLVTDRGLASMAITAHALDVLEEAGLVITRRAGREKLHFLNAIPIRLIHDRWIDKYTERQVSALVDLKTLLENKKWQPNRKRA